MVPAPSRAHSPRASSTICSIACHGVFFDEISVIEYTPRGGNGIRAKYSNDVHCEYDEVLTWGHFETSYKK